MSAARERNIWNVRDIVVNMRAAHQQGLDEGRTVSAEQIEEAARATWDDIEADFEPWSTLSEEAREIQRGTVRLAFRAAGIIVEEEG